ncbi:LacI family DNA-binding transcriptional regulator [Hoeflea prorocentri]|uniref:LacI family DNA-binding transcriptional regulator n=1 Tax=Hoeflea prorocentri TaxID=1922333 RepID=A0A9X3UKW9_9HYPH|nr:LacI family DNA-binding transcriptional regulator [Hoeflea prorocentri]MCY6382295.1 LacI family DNA-binding transcriptional regulator [Hoeflea prorocentri]MDA5400095.1 LacI family DNA-binding transcriptional regulator [Hoeflea prorocentri]
MKKRPTILDVARHAGVSKSTVSLVLQNSTLVKETTREDVAKAIADLGYVYNRSAAGLRGAASGLIGLIINDLRNPFFTEFAASAQMTFAQKGYSTVIANTDEDPDIQAQVIDSMIEHDVSAFVISPSYGGDEQPFDRIRRAGIPTMQVLRQVDERTDLFPFASHDYKAGGVLATEHLIDLGCRNIVFVGGLEDRPITLERMSGYVETMGAHALVPSVFHGRPSRVFGREIALKFLDSHRQIDAAICFSDLVALGMLSGLAEVGIRVGEDFKIVGFDDIEESSLAYPRLSSVRCDTALFGKNAAEAMLAWIVDGERPPDTKRYGVELTKRQSSLGAG